MKKRYLLILIISLAALFRLYGLNWDQGQHLHPDERFLTMVANDIRLPDLNPANAGYPFFVYGTFPLFLVKFMAILAGMDNYGAITILGRLISAFFDVGTVILVYLIAKIENWKLKIENLPLLACLFYAIAVLPIQLSHFFAVDTFLVFFLTLSFYLLLKRKIAILGIAFGLALASKISALLFLPIILLGILSYILSTHVRGFYKIFSHYLVTLGVFALFAYATFRIVNPYAFSSPNVLNPTLNPQFIQNIQQLRSWSDANTTFPPAIQWIKTKPIIFPLRNMLYYGLGLPLGLLAIGGIIYTVAARPWRASMGLSLALLWTLGLFLYQGTQFAKPMRYLAPIYPFLAIFAGLFFVRLLRFSRSKIYLLPVTCYLLLVLIWPLAFISIYSRPHSRVAASRWIYENIPAGSTLTCEHWDDCLPLPAVASAKAGRPSDYNILQLTLYDPDTPEKWRSVNEKLTAADYLILSSNRLYGSIPTVPERYPITSEFYNQLLSEQPLTTSNNIKFTKIAEFTSYPELRITNYELRINDSSADESFTVYDHPKVIIFRKIP